MILSMLDKDNDGMIDREEITAGLEMLNMDTRNHAGDIADQILRRVDSDGDGKISMAEWEAATANSDQDAISDAIEMLDINLGQFKDIIRYAFTQFDENGDGQISLEEFQLALGLLGYELPHEQSERIFYKLSGGTDFIVPDEYDEDPWRNAVEGFQLAMKTQYRSKGFSKAQYVLTNIWAVATEEGLPLATRLSNAGESLWSQAENLSDLAEFLVDILGVGLALASIERELSCVPKCREQEVDVANLIPLLFLLRSSISDALKQVRDSAIHDLDQDKALAFTKVFKPAGFSLSSFQQLLAQGQAEWRTLPKGMTIPYSVASNVLQIIVRGSVKIIDKSTVPGLSETVATVQAGSFLGAGKFIGQGDDWLDKSLGGSYLCMEADVLLLVWNTQKLKDFLQVSEKMGQRFQGAVATSMVATMGQVSKQSHQVAVELVGLFRDLSLRIKKRFCADRATLWMYNPKEGCLWTLFESEKGAHNYVSVPVSNSPIGYAFTSEQIVNIADCSVDDRFDQALDRLTGYHSRSMLCVPAFEETPKGRHMAIGVLQLINRKSAHCDDEARESCGGLEVEHFTLSDERKAVDCMWLASLMMQQMEKRYCQL